MLGVDELPGFTAKKGRLLIIFNRVAAHFTKIKLSPAPLPQTVGKRRAVKSCRLHFEVALVLFYKTDEPTDVIGVNVTLTLYWTIYM